LELTTSDLLDADSSKLLLLFIEDLDKLGLVLVAEFVSFDGSLQKNVYKFSSLWPNYKQCHPSITFHPIHLYRVSRERKIHSIVAVDLFK
jgi:hypothetical protein